MNYYTKNYEFSTTVGDHVRIDQPIQKQLIAVEKRVRPSKVD